MSKIDNNGLLSFDWDDDTDFDFGAPAATEEEENEVEKDEVEKKEVEEEEEDFFDVEETSTNKEDKLLYKRVMNHYSIFDFLTINIKHDIKILNFTDLQLDTVPDLDKTIKTFLSTVTQEEIYNLNEQIQ